eukprot:bmy_18662T0
MLKGFMQEAAISVAGCLRQFFTFGSLATAECFLLAVMAYDHYLAMCYPLLMGPRWYLGLVVIAWLSGFMADGLVVVLMAQLRFCGPNHTDHFYCDFMPLMSLVCSDPSVAQMTTFILSVICLTVPFGQILTSYACVVVAVLRVPAGASRWNRTKESRALEYIDETSYASEEFSRFLQECINFHFIHRIEIIVFSSVTAKTLEELCNELALAY